MKKRLFTLCLALTVVTFGAMAAEELYVGGKKVTLSGSGKVTVSGGDIKSGSVTYDRDTKTLTLSGVTITRSGNNNRGIRSSVSGLTVKFVGTNKITTTSAAGLRFEASTTITGSGTVTVKSNETALYVNKNTTVSISGVDRNRLTLNLDGKYGIQGEDGNSGEKVSIQRYVTLTASGSDNALTYLNNLTVSSDANVTLKGNDTNPTINSLASLTLGEGIVIDLPLGGKFNSSYKTIPEGKYMIGYKGDITINLAKVAINESNFPDYNFRSYILSSYASPVIDRNSDGYLSNAEIQATKEIYVVNKSIKNLTGIGCFTALTELNCSDNSLKSLNVSNNTKLKSLTCSRNQISGTAMTNLVNSLPSLPSSTNGYFYVCDDRATTDNVITNAQVNIATGKGWTVRKYTRSSFPMDYAGFDAIDINATNFPDERFCSYLLAQDYGKDKILTESEIKGITDLNVSYKGIKDLKGIEHFTALTKLNCSRNGLKSLDVSKNTALMELNCSNNSLTSLDVTKNTALTVLKCSDNSLKSLDVSKNTALRELYCGVNSLTSLDVTKNTALTVLSCSNNSLSPLDVSKNTALTALSCSNNSLKSLDVSKNTALTRLDCYVNSLESLDVSKNTALTQLDCYGNSLTSLDVTKNTALVTLICYGNQISGTAMTSLVNSLRSVSGRTCYLYVCSDKAAIDNIISTAQVNIATGKGWEVKKYGSDGKAVDYAGIDVVDIDATNFPDEKFRNYLLAQSYGKDGILTEPEIKSITDLNVYDKGIKDLTGIAYFTALTRLKCFDNSLTSLDVSKNTALTDLDCSGNSLTSLDVSKNTALTDLDCSGNSLISLDVSKNTALDDLYCYGNQIAGAAMTNLVNSLRSMPSGTEGYLFVCDDTTTPDNAISPAQVNIATGKSWTVKRYDGNGWMDYAGEEPGVAINATNFPDENFRALLLAQSYGKDAVLTEAEMLAVAVLDVSNKGIKNLTGIEYFTALTDLSCGGNSLESLNVSNNTALEGLYCYNNKLTSLDVSKNTALTWLFCDGNQISGAAMTNLVNSLRSLPSGTNGYFEVCSDEAVTDNVITPAQVNIAKGKGWTVKKDDGHEGVEYAGEEPITINATNFPDDNFRNYLLKWTDFGQDGFLTEKEIKGITELNVVQSEIADLTGIAFFTELESLNCHSCELTSLDLSNNTKLKTLECSINNLESLNVSNCTALTKLECGSNNLTSLDVSNCLLLEVLNCASNSLTSLVVSNISLLKELICLGNQISGKAMTKLVNNLPNTNGTLIVCYDYCSPDNVITAAQVKVAKGKGWMVKKCVEPGGNETVNYAGQGDANGDNKIDKNDLDAIEQIIMGKNPVGVGGYAGDLNNDGKVDAADIVVMINILNGK